uniref:SRR1-like domain-containing protein n=1 Tax=Moniliophthora roreri TaxID=221103 RepID=A0A0W0F970_MONRR
MTGDGEPRSTSFRYTEFSAPVSRKKRKNSQRPRPPLSTEVEQCRAELQQDNWLSRWREIVKSVPIQGPSGLICLGLGSPASSAVSRAQLAALIDLLETLDIAKSPSKVSIYDPVFTDEDNTLFGELGFRISPGLVNKQDERGTTVFFMPHCDLELYDAVLKANWSEEGLRNLILVANRLEDYVEK